MTGTFRDRLDELLVVDPRRTAILTVDMQRKYLDMEIGTSKVAPDDAERVLAATKRLLEFARERGMPVVHAYVRARRVEAESEWISSPTLRDITSSAMRCCSLPR